MKWILLIMLLSLTQVQMAFSQCFGQDEVAQDARSMLFEARHTMNVVRQYRLHPELYNATNSVARGTFEVEQAALSYRAYCENIRSLFAHVAHDYRYLNNVYARGRGHQHPALVQAMRELHFAFRRLSYSVQRL